MSICKENDNAKYGLNGNKIGEIKEREIHQITIDYFYSIDIFYVARLLSPMLTIVVASEFLMSRLKRLVL